MRSFKISLQYNNNNNLLYSKLKIITSHINSKFINPVICLIQIFGFYTHIIKGYVICES